MGERDYCINSFRAEIITLLSFLYNALVLCVLGSLLIHSSLHPQFFLQPTENASFPNTTFIIHLSALTPSVDPWKLQDKVCNLWPYLSFGLLTPLLPSQAPRRQCMHLVASSTRSGWQEGARVRARGSKARNCAAAAHPGLWPAVGEGRRAMAAGLTVHTCS